MVIISTTNKELICNVAAKLVNIGIGFDYRVKEDCILIDSMSKELLLYIFSPSELNGAYVFENNN